jgi:hypothetical protein
MIIALRPHVENMAFIDDRRLVLHVGGRVVDQHARPLGGMECGFECLVSDRLVVWLSTKKARGCISTHPQSWSRAWLVAEYLEDKHQGRDLRPRLEAGLARCIRNAVVCAGSGY